MIRRSVIGICYRVFGRAVVVAVTDFVVRQSLRRYADTAVAAALAAAATGGGDNTIGRVAA